MTKRIPTPMTRRLDPGPPAMSEADHAKALAEVVDAAKRFVVAQRQWHIDGHSSLTNEGYLLMDALDAYDKDHER